MDTLFPHQGKDSSSLVQKTIGSGHAHSRNLRSLGENPQPPCAAWRSEIPMCTGAFQHPTRMFKMSPMPVDTAPTGRLVLGELAERGAVTRWVSVAGFSSC